MTYFISGHREISQEEFDRLYKPVISEAIKDPSNIFVVGDYWGVDKMAQTYLAGVLEDKSRVTVYHMLKEPRVYVSKEFKKRGGFLDDESRDAAMTRDSDQDIAFVRPGKRNSGTAQNIIRRIELRWENKKRD